MTRELKSQRVLLTGAGGQLGKVLRDDLLGSVAGLRSSDRAPLAPLKPGETFALASLEDAAAVRAACRGIDAIVHLGGQAVEAPWDVVLNANIIGLINLYEAARAEGVKRVVFASSNHAIGFYPRSARLTSASSPRPDGRYGISKAFGEDLAYTYARKWGVETFVMRIGSCYPAPTNARMLSTWLSHPDFCRLVRVGLTADLSYEIVYGVSRNTRSWWDNQNAYRLGYEPRDDAEAFAGALAGKVTADLIEKAFQGGAFVSDEFAGDPTRLD